MAPSVMYTSAPSPMLARAQNEVVVMACMCCCVMYESFVLYVINMPSVLLASYVLFVSYVLYLFPLLL